MAEIGLAELLANAFLDTALDTEVDSDQHMDSALDSFSEGVSKWSDELPVLSGFGSLWNKWTGRGLTNAQIIQNRINAEEAAKSRAYNTAMSNTQYQRGVIDMQKAGLNPALMMSKGASPAPVGSVAQATAADNNNGMDFQTLISLMMMPFTISNMQANTRNTEVRTEGESLKNQYQSLVNGFYPTLTQTQIDEMVSSIAGNYANVDLTKSQKELVDLDRIIRKAEADKSSELVKARLDLMEAQTDAARKAGMASAASAFIDSIQGRYMRDNNMMMTSSEALAVVEALAGYLGAGGDSGSAVGDVTHAVTNELRRRGGQIVSDLRTQVQDRRNDRGNFRQNLRDEITGYRNSIRNGYNTVRRAFRGRRRR